MPFELRLVGKEPQLFETEQAAMQAAGAIVADDPDAEPEVVDLQTGKAAAPGADAESREQLKSSLGY